MATEVPDVATEVPDVATPAPGLVEPSTEEEPSPGRWQWWDAAVPALLLAAFGGLLAGVLAGGPVISVDHQVRSWVLAHSSARLVRLSTAVTNVGSPGHSVIALAVVATFLGWRRRRTGPMLLSGLAAGVLAAAVLLIKMWVHRPGPELPMEGPLYAGYFPSGHTTSAVVCYGIIALLLVRRADRWHRWIPYAAGGGAGLLVGLCLIYSNFHWLSDVLAGWALGGTLLWLAMLAASRLPTGTLSPGPD
ncbi:MAG TPA: phosphatase PAP2 family protein [Mycobacteriales bacterium]|nr:phosphatase PAP2 family protein [Mycobacteriales bacterium]